jgi:DNA-binding NarL/FixJ family response regulator
LIRKKVLVVEDHPLFVQAIGEIVSRIDPAAEVQGAHTLADALASLQRGGPDLVLLDLNLPDVSGLDGVAALRQRLPEVPIVVISAMDDPDLVRDLEQSGIHRFVSKSAKPAEIIESIRQVFHAAAGLDRRETPPSPEVGKRTALSQRQVEVLQEMATGKSNKEIARSLDIAVDTVRAHVVEILARLGVRNRTEAVTVFYSGQYEVSR